MGLVIKITSSKIRGNLLNSLKKQKVICDTGGKFTVSVRESGEWSECKMDNSSGCACSK